MNFIKLNITNFKTNFFLSNEKLGIMSPRLDTKKEGLHYIFVTLFQKEILVKPKNLLRVLQEILTLECRDTPNQLIDPDFREHVINKIDLLKNLIELKEVLKEDLGEILDQVQEGPMLHICKCGTHGKFIGQDNKDSVLFMTSNFESKSQAFLILDVLEDENIITSYDKVRLEINIEKSSLPKLSDDEIGELSLN